MSYIGSTPTSQNFISGTDYFNGTGSQTAFTLARSVNSVNDIEVVVNNVIQQPNSYTVSGTTLTLSAAPSSGTSNVYVRYLATTQQSFTVGNNTVGYNQLTSDMQSKFAMKNRIINGAMVIDQRNAGASVTIGAGTVTYTLDRWSGFATQASKFTIQQNAGSVTLPAGFSNYLGVTSSSAYSVGSGEQFKVYQPIEGFNTADLGWGTANAKTVTLSFQVYSSLTGTFGGALQNSASSRSYPFTYTISSANTWEQKSVTIAGDTTGTWLTTSGVGIYVQFGLGVGTTLSGTAGAWASANYISATGATSVVGTNGATFYITGVQLEVGSSATGFEYRQYGQELALCQRYYFALNSANVGSNGIYFAGVNTSTNLRGAVIPPVTMRTAPSLTSSAGSTFYVQNGASNLVPTTAATIGSTTTGSQTLSVVSGNYTAYTTGYAGQFIDNTGASFLNFSAEL